jgi:hypothetical protein
MALSMLPALLISSLLTGSPEIQRRCGLKLLVTLNTFLLRSDYWDAVSKCLGRGDEVYKTGAGGIRTQASSPDIRILVSLRMGGY